MRPARDIPRFVSVLLVAGLWALTLVWTPAARIAEERELTSLSQAEGANLHPATKTPKFGVHDERRANVDQVTLFESSSALVMRSVTEVDAPVASGSPIVLRHSSPRSARGPPVRG